MNHTDIVGRMLRSLACFALSIGSGSTLAASSSGFGHYEPSRQFSERVSHSLYLPMRDGVRLAVRISQPARDGQAAPGRFPVIWQHTISITEPHIEAGQKQPGYQGVPTLTDYGYVVVQVARRGNGQSFGVRRGYNDRTEDDDAFEVTEWLAHQPWSNGMIGIYGCSNTGDAAMHAIAARAPHLKAAFAGCFSWSKFDAFHRGGIYAQWGVGITRSVDQDMMQEPVDGDADKQLLRQAAQEHQASTNLPQLWQSMPFRDSWSALVASRFWYEGSVSSFAQQLRESGTALYIQGGWHDELRDQGLVALLNYPHAHILIGPWMHCRNPGFELLQEIHRFFDTYLKGVRTGLSSEAPIHYFVQQGDGGSWRSASSWPLPATQKRRWYLTHGTLQHTAPEVSSSADFHVDAPVSCPPHEGAADQIGPYQQPCHIPGQGVSFAAAPLDSAQEITGHPILRLFMKTNRPEAHVFAYLEDVAPDGSIRIITEGRLKASLRALATPDWRMPGIPWHRAWVQDALSSNADESIELQFDLMPTSYVFATGHRIGLTLTGYDHRESDPLTDHVTIDVLSAPDAASFIELPTVPAATGS